MRAGTLRDLITIKEPVRQTQSYGGPRPPRGPQYGPRRTVVAGLAAEIRGLRGQELRTEARELGVVSHRIEIRYMPGLLPHMEVYEDHGEHRVFDLLGVRDPDGRRRCLILDCKEMPEWRTESASM